MNTRTRFAIASTLALAGLVLLLNVPSSFAQSIYLRANVPFDFYIGNKLMPAGTYIVKPQANGAAIQVSDGNGNNAIVGTSATSNREPQKPRLVFHRYGDVSFLSELYWQGYDFGHALQKSARELEASNGAPSNTIQVATSNRR